MFKTDEKLRLDKNKVKAYNSKGVDKKFTKYNGRMTKIYQPTNSNTPLQKAMSNVDVDRHLSHSWTSQY